MTTRDTTNGRFLPGNPGGPGRPRRAVEREYLELTLDACPAKEWTAIVRRAVTQAKKGDARARQWLSDIIVGRDPAGLRDVLDELRERAEELRNGRG